MAGTRLQIVSAFVVFSLLVAPFAWKLTQVRRVDLPFDRVERLAASQSVLLTWPRDSVAVVYADDSAFGQDGSHQTQVTSQMPSLVFQFHLLSKTQKSSVSQSLAAATSLHQLDDLLLDSARDTEDRVDQFSFFLLCEPKRQRDLLSNDKSIVVGKHRHAWSFACSMKEAHEQFVRLLSQHVFPATASTIPFSQPSLRARSALRYRLSFSLMKESPETHWHWRFPSVAKRFLVPFIEKVSCLAFFTIEHQVLQYARIAKQVYSQGDTHYVKASDLQQFFSVNDVLDASVLNDREQVLRFKAALPVAAHSPLFIVSSEQDITSSSSSSGATSFEIPSLGGVCILDTQQLVQSKQLEDKQMERMMSMFVTQLRDLLGFPSFSQREQQENSVVFLPALKTGVCEWEMDVQLRHRVDELFKWTLDSLISIEKLVREMPQMAVLERVEHRITSAVRLLEEVQSHVLASSLDHSQPVDWQLLVEKTRQACDQADQAYYDPTMIRQLYFPQEHMLGVYAPLLAPLFLPFFMGFVRELKRFRHKRSLQAKQKQE